MNIINWITTLFANNNIRGTHTDASCNEEKHMDDTSICKGAKASVGEKDESETTIPQPLNSKDRDINIENNTDLGGNTNVQSENPAETISSAEKVLPNQQLRPEHLIEYEEVAESEEQKNKQKDTDPHSERVQDKTLCKGVKNATEESAAAKDEEKDLPIEMERGKQGVNDALIDCGEGTPQNNVDNNPSENIQKSENKSCEVQKNLPEMQNEELLTYLLDNSEPEFRGKTGDIFYSGFSMRGYMHSENDIKCQDKCAIRVMGVSNNYVVAGIADGLGSCAFSDEGAAVAISSALNEINKLFAHEENPTDDDIIDTLKLSMRTAYESVAKYADQKGEELNEYYSTLTVVIYDGKDAFIAHAGDDGVVVLTDSGFYGLVTTRHKGDTVNSVVPLQGETNWEFMIVRDIVGIVMATDGVLDAFVKREKEENRVLFPFIQLITKAESDEITILEKYKSLFKTEGMQNLITDDITLISMINNKTMKETEFPSFDEKEWFKKNRERSESIFKALYPDQKLTEDIADSWLDRDKELLHSLELLKML